MIEVSLIEYVDPVKLVVAGHVDHGKSTLIGRLLLSHGKVPDDKLEKLERLCNQKQITFEPAFLLDAFEEERDQGVTIDSTRVEITIDSAQFLLIDAPGHAQFLKHMIAASAGADCGMLVLDISQGVQEQTIRHARLLKIMGISQVIVLINKLDVAKYNQSQFEACRKMVLELLELEGLSAVYVIPIVALTGEGIDSFSEAMVWYRGETLIEALLSLTSANLRRGNLLDKQFRMILQDVYRFEEQRFFVGRVQSGELKRGERILFSPAGKAATVKSIGIGGATDVDSCKSGDSVAFVLDEPLFVERGELISRPGEAPEIADRIQASLAWLSSVPNSPSFSYVLKSGTAETKCTVEIIGAQHEAVPLAAGSVAEAILSCEHAIAFDASNSKSPGSPFVLCNAEGTVAAGSLDRVFVNNAASQIWIRPESGYVRLDQIEAQQGHGAVVVWLTGLPASGKSTIARATQNDLFASGIRTVVLDGDDLRAGICQDLGFSAEDRRENLRRIAHIARLFLETGQVVLVACVSPYARDRELARRIVGPEKFLEVHVACTLAVCQERDPKGFYAKNARHRLTGLTGYDSPYQLPNEPDLLLDTTVLTVHEETEKLVSLIKGALGAKRHVLDSNTTGATRSPRSL